jgi:hypothetical protein
MSDTQEAVTNSAEATPTDVTAKVINIEVENPTVEEMSAITASIKANYDFDVSVKPVNFNFKKSKDKDTGIETNRNTVQLPIPYPSVQGLINIIETGGKGLELVMEAMESVVNTAARDLLYDNLDMNAANFPADKVAWDFISKLPKAQRKGGGIPKEVWEAFAASYCEIMPEATGKSMEQVANAAKMLQNKFSAVKTNMPVLNLLVEQLCVYTDAAGEDASEFQECIDFLVEKADMLLNVSPESLLAAL